MMLATLLLSWLQPVGPATSSALSFDQLAGFVRTELFQETSIKPNRWSVVQIAAGPPQSSSGQRLAAVPSRVDYHFVVDSTGRIRSSSRWQAQRPLPEAPYAIRIRIDQSAKGAPMTKAQWYCIEAVTRELSRYLAPAGESLPIQLDREWARVYEVDESTVYTISPTGG